MTWPTKRQRQIQRQHFNFTFCRRTTSWLYKGSMCGGSPLVNLDHTQLSKGGISGQSGGSVESSSKATLQCPDCGKPCTRKDTLQRHHYPIIQFPCCFFPPIWHPPIMAVFYPKNTHFRTHLDLELHLGGA